MGTFFDLVKQIKTFHLLNPYRQPKTYDQDNQTYYKKASKRRLKTTGMIDLALSPPFLTRGVQAFPPTPYRLLTLPFFFLTKAF